MKAAFLLLSAWLLSGCVTPGSRTSDSRDYAITRKATAQEIELVQNESTKLSLARARLQW
jgi:uncharacterized protein YceK